MVRNFTKSLVVYNSNILISGARGRIFGHKYYVVGKRHVEWQCTCYSWKYESLRVSAGRDGGDKTGVREMFWIY